MNCYRFALLGACLLTSLLQACLPIEEQDLVVEGMKPIYIAPAATKQIYADTPRNISNLGKIYTKPPFVYINDSGTGVHVIDNSNPAQPQRVAFIHIPGNKDIAIKGNYMYADNFTDLVTLDISNLADVQVVSRVEGLYPLEATTFPLNYNGYFECADSDKGIVLAWEKTTLTNPRCRR